MAGITLDEAQAQLATWLSANTTLAYGQSVQIDGRSVTLADCLKQIEFWDRQVARLSRGSQRTSVQRVVASGD